NYPLVPSKPNKVVVFLVGAVMSLLISLGFAVVVDVFRQTICTPSQVEMFWNLPILADIPQIVTDSELRAFRRQKFVRAASSATVVIISTFLLYLIYQRPTIVMRSLVPVLQKLVYQ